MVPDHGGDTSLYDFLIEEPEMIPATSAHFDNRTRPQMGQQPISPPHRTSSQPQRPLPNDPRHASTPPLHALSTAPLHDPSRAPPRVSPALPQGVDLHSQSPGTVTTSSFAAPVSPAPGVSLPMEWGLYGIAQPAAHMNPAPFDYELPRAMMPTMPPQHGLHAHHQAMLSGQDPTFVYGAEVVSPMTIHSPQSRYAYNGWGDVLGQESSTPTVTTPAASAQQNPWVEADEYPGFGEALETAQKKKPARSRRIKKEGQASAGSPSDTAPSPSSTSQHSRTSIGSKATSMASTSTTSSTSKLRSASRTSKNSHARPGDTIEDRRTRASHNLVEKQYRNRLNAQFESLLSALPNKAGGAPGEDEDSDGMGDSADRRVSKGEVLERARNHIQLLEKERIELERENNELLHNLRQLQNQPPAGRSQSGEFGFKAQDDGFHHSPEQ